MTFKGAWLPTYGYAANDAVSYGNPASTYIALMSNSSAEPDTSSAWEVLAQAGSVGPSGPMGGAATVSVGTVTTGPAGSLAQVTNVGTSSAAVLNFTIPQGATGSGGSGGGSASGVPYASVYHAVVGGSPLYLVYYSVSNSTSTSTEFGSANLPYSVLTWVPSGCTASSLDVFSQQSNAITVTLRTGASATTMADTPLVCSGMATGTSCKATGSLSVPAGGFVDLSITGASATQGAVWTALTCN